MNEITFRNTTPDDAEFVVSIMDKSWGGEPLVVRGKNYYPSKLPGILAMQGDQLAGFIFYEFQGSDCEVVVFEVYDKFKGTGTKLMNLFKDAARQHGSKRLFLITHNDNMDALRFYQKRGFTICNFYLNSLEIGRKMKPCIPLVGDYGIPLRDEIELEHLL